MKKKILFLHTEDETVGRMSQAFYEQYSREEAELINLVDDGLIPDFLAHNNQYSPLLLQHMAGYVRVGQDYGCVAAACMCTIFSPVMDRLAPFFSIPLFKIDQGVYGEAAARGQHMAVMITGPITIPPSTDTMQVAFQKAGKTPDVELVIVEGAAEVRSRNDMDTYDQLVRDKIREIDGRYDIIVMAQGSMTRGARMAGATKTPVLTSIEPGMRQLADCIRG